MSQTSEPTSEHEEVVAEIRIAAEVMGMSFDSVLRPALTDRHGRYDHYRWSASSTETGDPAINAFPPDGEEEWGVWERWESTGDTATRRSLVMNAGTGGWIESAEPSQPEQLLPRLLVEPFGTREKLRLARVEEAAAHLGRAFGREVLDPLGDSAGDPYASHRWVAMSHILALGPVVYALPPLPRADVLPWESWYLTPSGALTHHVHFTVARPGATGPWRDGAGAPQRPREVPGRDWHWFDMPAPAPYLLSSTREESRP